MNSNFIVHLVSELIYNLFFHADFFPEITSRYTRLLRFVLKVQKGYIKEDLNS
jgi:hypothetical protein